MPAVARLNDTSDHGGIIITASNNVRANGIWVARVGDFHACPLEGHGVTPIISSPIVSRNQTKAIAAVGSVCGCGAVIVTGSPTVGTF